MRVGYTRMPERTPEERFMELAADAVDGLPEWVHDAMDNVEVFVEDLPPPDDPGLLGLYHGVPLSDRGTHYAGVLPDHITLYRVRSSGESRGERRSAAARHRAHGGARGRAPLRHQRRSAARDRSVLVRVRLPIATSTSG